MGKKKWSKEEKKLIVLEMLQGNKSVSQISKEYGVSDGMLYRWRNNAIEAIDRSLTKPAKNDNFSAERNRLMKIIGEQTCVIETLKKISGKI